MRTSLIQVIAATVTAALVLAACVTTKEAQQRAQHAEQLHAGAPAWFRNYWREYLEDAVGYAVMAIDRRGRGASYYYCTSGDCHNAALPQVKSFLDVHYTHAALNQCREQVRQNHPLEKPDCAVYAVKDKIVWKGALPWEAGRATRAKPVRKAGLERRSIAVTWEGIKGVLTGEVVFRRGARSGDMTITGENGVTCEGQYWTARADLSGWWESDCGGGLTATGHFTGLGADKGARGEGQDNLGRKVQFILGGAGSG